MNIREWHEHLYNHFTALHEERLGSDYSIFAFEHGLDDDRREELKGSIYEHLTRLSPDERYWLPWVVYSAEIGYEFGGREYWHTFEDKTPGWRIRENRNFVRNGFKKFVESFSGFKPSGAWANHRTIISYPITHAILPKDFQSRLIRILTTLRPY